MSDFDYDTELKRAQEASVGLREELEGRILGETKWAAEAVRVNPAGRKQAYEYQITDSLMWHVTMQKKGEKGKRYSIGISDFIPQEETDEIFARHFVGIDSERLTKEYFVRERKKRDKEQSDFMRIFPLEN